MFPLAKLTRVSRKMFRYRIFNFGHYNKLDDHNNDSLKKDDDQLPFTKRTFLHRHRIILFPLFLTVLVLLFYLLWIFWLGNWNFFDPSMVPKNNSYRYLVLTKNCHIKNWTLFDVQTSKLFQEITSDQTYDCTSSEEFAAKLMLIERQNRTWIRWSNKPNDKNLWKCYGREIKFNGSDDGMMYGKYLGPLPNLYNFDSDLMTERWKNSTKKTTTNVERQKWDAVEMMCNRTNRDGWWKKTLTYTRVIPLIQIYQIRKSLNQANPNAPNVLMLGLDSVSRLNFLRHFHKTEQFLNENHFVPLYGHHKVGENTFPNLIPMFTGYPHTHYWNESIGSKLKFDNISVIFFEYQRRGYLTTFIEDMPPYGTFTYKRGGFRHQPTDYYLRPVNLAIWKSIYSPDSACYQGEIEYEIYYQYILELLELFRNQKPSRPHLTISHWSTLIHNELNNAAFADRVFARFIRRLFKAKLQENTVIVFYSDHGIRIGPIQNTMSGIYEQRLPFLYLYISDSVNISGLNGKQLRHLVRTNQRRLTSHFDLHATMRHILEGKPPSTEEPYGLSLFTPIPENRTCDEAGIPSHFCVCGSMKPAPLNKKTNEISQFVVDELNNRLKPYSTLCATLTLNSTQFALVAVDEFDDDNSDGSEETDVITDVDSAGKPARHYIVQFKVNPSDGIFESTAVVEHRSGNMTIVVGDISRINKYGHQSKCIKNNFVIERYCYCKDNDKL